MPRTEEFFLDWRRAGRVMQKCESMKLEVVCDAEIGKPTAFPIPKRRRVARSQHALFKFEICVREQSVAMRMFVPPSSCSGTKTSEKKVICRQELSGCSKIHERRTAKNHTPNPVTSNPSTRHHHRSRSPNQRTFQCWTVIVPRYRENPSRCGSALTVRTGNRVCCRVRG